MIFCQAYSALAANSIRMTHTTHLHWLELHVLLIKHALVFGMRIVMTKEAIIHVKKALRILALLVSTKRKNTQVII